MKKTIKILSTITIALLLIFTISLSIAAIDSDDPYNKTYQVSVSREIEKTAMKRFEEAILSGSNTVNMNGLNISADNADELFVSFLFDNPRYSFMCSTKYGSSYMAYLASININYKWSPSNYQSMLSEIDAEVAKICAKINPSWSDIQKILWVNDYMCDVYEYDYDLVNDDLYSMIYYQKGTCQGYTKLFKAIMDNLGIECSFSSSDQIAHVWNIVKVDGKWYHIDVTWNDNPSTRGRILLSSDTNSYKEHAKGYTISTISDAIQKFACSSTKYDSYFWTNGLASGFGFEGTTTAYAFDLSGNFKKYNLSNGTSQTMFNNSDKWAAPTPGYYWNDHYGDVVCMGDVMFYSTARSVYSYNVSSGTSTKIFETDQFYIYAILYDGTYITCIDYNYDINKRPLVRTLYQFEAPSVSSKFNVTWKNYDGTVLETDQNVAFGATPTYNGATPTKAATAEYTYTFAGWTPTISNVTSDVVYTATFNQTKNKYTINWKNEDGSLIKSEQVEYGVTPSFQYTPTKQSDGQYSYTFAGWSPTIVPVTGDATYTATFTQTKLTFIVTWKNYDSSVLENDTGVEYGTTPTYNGSIPTRPATAEYTYEFTGWTPVISPVTKNVTYTAQFSATKRSYTITWKNWDGTVLKTDTVAYGKTPAYSGTAPTRASDSQYNYSFKGWTPSISTVSGDATYVAEFNKTAISIETTSQTVTETTTVETTTETTTESTTEATTETTTKESTTETTTVETIAETTTESTSEETTETTESIETTEVTETTETVETTDVIETTEETETTETTNKETETTEPISTESVSTGAETTEGVTTTSSLETTPVESTEEITTEVTTDAEETTTENVTETKPQETTAPKQEGFDFIEFVNNVIEKIKEGNVVYIAVTAAAGLVVLGLLILILKAIFRKKK